MRSIKTFHSAIAIGTLSLAIILPARAESGRNATAIGGLAAGALLGGAIAAGGPENEPGDYAAPTYEEEYAPVCHLERQAVLNSWGDVVRFRRVRVCD